VFVICARARVNSKSRVIPNVGPTVKPTAMIESTMARKMREKCERSVW